ncbi:isopenicillin N synthase-like dioxygenase [Mucilaginibacter gracilis]|uniref:2-oxoglutarate-dependent ethylene/succinate-forming enzyme n=1 Tax=Mucilaginibacter gracilis TaxID=423350 RepID=A0A495IWK3_9SPHI|nr:2-oxoglutarate and iron-dependent oxygenase domain-containing protein [Mucilaginibacter gracilis]RKR80404.1 isopenicillin N synthase-like dioxygenase [Mucilaginibacter gracilis]
MHKTIIPIIDFQQIDNPEHQVTIARQIYHACTEHGFFYVSGHDVDDELQGELMEKSKLFFALVESEKLKIAMAKGGSAWRGFFPVNAELTSGKPDKKEGLYFGTELPDDHPKVNAGIPLHGRNLFPDYPPGFDQTVLAYVDAVTETAQLVMKGIALSLGLPANYFYSKYTSDPLILFRIFHYPTQAPKPAQWGVGEHTDYGLLTVLLQDSVGGLQVKSKGEWIDAPPIPGTFICNIGDMLDKMTGGLYRSTPHRVLNTSGQSRLSFPLFFDPGFDSKIEAITNIPDNIREQDTSQRWDKTNIHAFEGTYGEYLLQKIGKVFPGLRKEVL